VLDGLILFFIVPSLFFSFLGRALD